MLRMPGDDLIRKQANGDANEDLDDSLRVQPSQRQLMRPMSSEGSRPSIDERYEAEEYSTDGNSGYMASFALPPSIDMLTADLDELEQEVWEQLKYESGVKMTLWNLMCSKLHFKNHDAKPLQPPPLKELNEAFSKSFRGIDYSAGEKNNFRNILRSSAHNGKMIFGFWKAMIKVFRPWKAIVASLVPGLYQLGLSLIIKDVVNVAMSTGDGVELWLGGAIMFVIFNIQLYAGFVFEIEVPGGGVRLLLRVLVQRQLMAMQMLPSVGFFAQGAIGSILSESCRNAVSLWSLFFSSLQEFFTLFCLMTFTATANSTGNPWSVLIVLTVYVFCLLAATFVFLARDYHRIYLHKKQLIWRMNYLSCSSSLLETRRITVKHTEEEKAHKRIETDVNKKLLPQLFAYRKRGFQRYMYDYTTGMAIAELGFLSYFFVIFSIGYLLKYTPAYADLGTLTAIIVAAEKSANTVVNIYKMILNATFDMPFADQISQILLFKKEDYVQQDDEDAVDHAKAHPVESPSTSYQRQERTASDHDELTPNDTRVDMTAFDSMESSDSNTV